MREEHPRATCRLLAIGIMLTVVVSTGLGAQDTTPPSDFNGDGYADLAIGAVGEDIGRIHDSGTAAVLYGTRRGLRGRNSQAWHQALIDVEDDAEEGDSFGFSFTTGDFNGDGYADLAVGVPNEEVNGFTGAGAVNVFYGSLDGLTDLDDQLWHQDVGTIDDFAWFDEFFGYSLGACDFNTDGYTDLAVGVPGENGGAGGVQVIYGSLAGLTDVDDQLWTQDTGTIQDFGQIGDSFGASLATGDFNGDHWCDLAIGVPGETVSGYPLAGAAHVLYGAWTGLSDVGNQFWNQDSEHVFHDRRIAVAGRAEEGDLFGSTLTAGDFNGDGFSDLAIGVIGEDIENRQFDAGAVNVLYGFHEGLLAFKNKMWHQDVPGILNNAEPDDRFGYSLAAGDFDGDGYDDLAVGVAHEDVNHVLGAGAVNVIYGSKECLTSDGDQFWFQSKNDIKEKLGSWDMFGSALATGDYDGDGFDDLAIGVINETIGSRRFGAGAVNVMYGSRRKGLRPAENQLWHQSLDKVPGTAELYDFFGAALGSR